MTEKIIIVLLLIALFYYYRQSQNSAATKDDSSDLVRDLQTQLRQANQLETYNGQQLTNYENKVQNLQKQLETYQKGDDWESRSGEIITDLETENKRLDEILARTANEKNNLEDEISAKQEQLNSILNKWNWGNWKPKSAEEFINKFEPWINKHLESAEKLKVAEQKLVDFQSEVERLKSARETTEEIENLESERDEAIREKRESEAELLAVNNRLKNKSQEADNKVKEIERLKKEKSQSEIALNKTITELRKELAQLGTKRSEYEALQKKYSKQAQLLDEEQLESKKLTEENEQLTQKVKELKYTTSSTKDFDYAEELEAKGQRILELTSSQTALTTELAQTKEKLALEKFIQWTRDQKELNKVDWNYYCSQPDWEKAFRNWNKLYTERIRLLEIWKTESTK